MILTEEHETALKSTGLIDLRVFMEVLEMDDEEDDGTFSLSLYLSFEEQALETFGRLTKALRSQDYGKVSELGHYLKGSAATLGLVKITEQCEKIESCGRELKKEKHDGDKVGEETKDDKEKTEISDEDKEQIKAIEEAQKKANELLEKSMDAVNMVYHFKE